MFINLIVLTSALFNWQCFFSLGMIFIRGLAGIRSVVILWCLHAMSMLFIYSWSVVMHRNFVTMHPLHVWCVPVCVGLSICMCQSEHVCPKPSGNVVAIGKSSTSIFALHWEDGGTKLQRSWERRKASVCMASVEAHFFDNIPLGLKLDLHKEHLSRITKFPLLSEFCSLPKSVDLRLLLRRCIG